IALLLLTRAPLAGQTGATVDAPQALPPARHFVWRVAKNDAPVAWLVGSVHVLKSDAYPLPDVFQKAFRESGVLIEEVDLGAANDMAAVMPAASKALLTGGATLGQLLDRETYALVESKAAAAGVPMLLLERVKPWMVAMTLSVPALRQAGFDPALGLDQHFFDRAQADKRPVRGLETVAYQIDRLDGLSLEVQIAMLKAVLSDVDTQVAAVGEIVAAWRAGDVAALEQVLLQEFRESPAVYQRLLVERNEAWTPKIAACAAEPRPCLVVVGGAHLVGPDSVVALLRRAGFTVEQQ
ncbi:MAG TPA: TraB/GumN family protein, partial [Nonomuraea sp.]|nr:TraB/GumN family protein [Nonomuraea sp.]